MYLGESRRAVCFRRSETAAAERKAFVAGVASAFEDIFGGDEELRIPHPRCWFKLSQRSGGGRVR